MTFNPATFDGRYNRRQRKRLEALGLARMPLRHEMDWPGGPKLPWTIHWEMGRAKPGGRAPWRASIRVPGRKDIPLCQGRIEYETAKDDMRAAERQVNSSLWAWALGLPDWPHVRVSVWVRPVLVVTLPEGQRPTVGALAGSPKGWEWKAGLEDRRAEGTFPLVMACGMTMGSHAAALGEGAAAVADWVRDNAGPLNDEVTRRLGL